jgi:magnesium-transporting ATPase (P-type)
VENTPLHELRPSQVFQALETSPNGLDREQAKARLSLYGPNTLTVTSRASIWSRYAYHFVHLMALLLWGAGVLAFLGGEPGLGIVIWVVVLINGLFSVWREYQAEQAVAALAKLMPTYARVLRGGQEMKVLASELVPGDVLVLAEGDNIPADARLVEEYGLRANNTTLTGDSVPARKSAEGSLREGLTELERPCLVFAGTSVVSGTGRAVVFATGMLTQFGRIAHLTQAVRVETSPLQRELRRVTRVISVIAIGIGAVVFIVGISEVGMPRFEAFLLGIGILVAAVPEGLSPILTLSLAIAVQRLSRRGVLVKKLSVIETLGTVSVICTDKSGTLTQNQMTIREVWVGGRRLKVTGIGYDPSGEFQPNPDTSGVRSDLQNLLTAALLCNNSRLNPPTPEKPQWTSLGDQTEAALRVLALKGKVDEQSISTILPRVHELPFDARRKRMSTIHRELSLGGEVAFVKGAPREVLQLCTQIFTHGQTRPLDEALRTQILAANDDYAVNALRVLALASRSLPPRSGAYTVEKVETDLTFLGLVAMMDPPREEVAGAVQRCRQGGIRLVMITGDYGLTAESMARRLGMLSTPRPLILTGAEVDAISDVELRSLLRDNEIVFARMAPEHKLRLVSIFQEEGEVVAVIGDGVNDTPALRKADIGISMGIIGTDVAKEAADVILTNDDFSAIATALEEGRAVYDNLRKFISYIFASNVPEIIPFLLTALLNLPLALTVRQILVIDLGTDVLPALALGTEKPEPDVMLRPPRRRAQPLIDPRLLRRAFIWLGLIETVLCYAGFAAVYVGFGYGHMIGLPAWHWLEAINPRHLPPYQVEALAQTVFFAGLVTAQIGNAFACRSETARGRRLGWLSNRFLLLAVAMELVLMGALVYVWPLPKLFSLQPVPPEYWFGLLAFAPILYSLDRIRKSLAQRLGARRTRMDEGGSRA